MVGIWRVWERKVGNTGKRGKNKRGVGSKCGNGPWERKGMDKKGG